MPIFNDSETTNGLIMKNDTTLDVGEGREQTIMSISTILHTISFAILCPLIIVCNSIIIAVFAKMGKLSGQSVYKASIAFSDLLFGTLAYPMFMGFMHTGGNNFTLLTVSLTIVRVSMMVSLSAMLVMGFDRLYAVLRPTKYGFDKSRKIATVVTIASWSILSMAIIVITILTNDLRDPEDEEGHNANWAFMVAETVVLATALVLVWVNNFTVYRVVKDKMNATDLGDSANTSRLKKHKDVVITLCAITGVFTLSTLPLIVFSTIVIQNKVRLFSPEYEIPAMVTHTIFDTNCLWNCFVYSFRNKKFRDEAKQIFRSCGRDILSGAKEGISAGNITTM